MPDLESFVYANQTTRDFDPKRSSKRSKFKEEEEESSEEVMPSRTTARQTSMLSAQKEQPRRAAFENSIQIKNDFSPVKNRSEDYYPN